ncbi:MAG: hypothetical protein KME31_33685 [Tolypothrix carrinoi HA7290-LM1]|nr:hypothetical protein [Tolypothrix carrinoi HA7290-LM1]
MGETTAGASSRQSRPTHCLPKTQRESQSPIDQGDRQDGGWSGPRCLTTQVAPLGQGAKRFLKSPLKRGILKVRRLNE